MKRYKLIIIANWTRTKSAIRRFLNRRPNKRLWLPGIPGIVVFVAIGCSLVYWHWLRGYVDGIPPDNLESPSTTIRNLALGLAGFIALVIALWRGWVANRQADIADQQLLNERYQRATEMLGSDIMSVRLGGVFQLERLAGENPERYHIPVSQSLCAFVREPPDPVGNPTPGGRVPFSHVPADISAALDAIQSGDRRDRRFIEIRARYLPSLRGAKLTGASLIGLELSGFVLDDADLTGAVLNGCDLTESSLWNVVLTNAELKGASLVGADLFLAQLDGADFTDVDLAQAIVTGADFSDTGQNPARGLTQLQIGTASAEVGHEPDLEGVVDSISGKPLVWNGFPIYE